jgi:hypothetical protein
MITFAVAVVYLVGYFVVARKAYLRLDAQERTDWNMVSAAFIALFWPIALAVVLGARYRGSGRHRADRRTEDAAERDVEVRSC